MQDTGEEAGASSKEMYSDGRHHMAEQKQDDQLEPIYSSFLRIRDVALRTSQNLWTIGRGGERGSGISVLLARQNEMKVGDHSPGWREGSIFNSYYTDM